MPPHTQQVCFPDRPEIHSDCVGAPHMVHKEMEVQTGVPF